LPGGGAKIIVTPVHLNYAATLPCNLSLMARFADINVVFVLSAALETALPYECGLALQPHTHTHARTHARTHTHTHTDGHDRNLTPTTNVYY